MRTVLTKTLCCTILAVACFFLSVPGSLLAQRKPEKSGSHSSRPRATMSAEARALLEEASAVVCTQAKLDPKSSVAIDEIDRKSTRLNSSHSQISYAVFCLKKKIQEVKCI